MKGALIIGLVLVSHVLISGISGCEKEVTLNNNELLINTFNYTYDNMVSHICPGSRETFNFSYNGKLMSIIAQKKELVPGRGYIIEDYSYCGIKGTLMNFYNYAEGVPLGLPSACKITEQLPASFNRPEYITAECSMHINFEILNLNKFNSCISKENCELINGVDVQKLDPCLKLAGEKITLSGTLTEQYYCGHHENFGGEFDYYLGIIRNGCTIYIHTKNVKSARISPGSPELTDTTTIILDKNLGNTIDTSGILNKKTCAYTGETWYTVD